jgi:RES domain-containing protein
VFLHSFETVSDYFTQHCPEFNIRVANLQRNDILTKAFVQEDEDRGINWFNLISGDFNRQYALNPTTETVLIPSPKLTPSTYALTANFIHDQSVADGILHTT